MTIDLLAVMAHAGVPETEGVPREVARANRAMSQLQAVQRHLREGEAG